MKTAGQQGPFPDDW